MQRVYIFREWEAQSEQLDFEIRKAQSQLKSVEKRLHSIKTDLYLYLILFLLPYIFKVIIDCLCAIISPITIVPFTIIYPIYLILTMLYFLYMPFVSHKLVSTIILIYINYFHHAVASAPALRTAACPKSLDREASYLIEKEKLHQILSKYYFYRSILDQIKRQIDDGTLTMSLEDLQEEFTKMPFYQELRAADPFAKEDAKNLRRLTMVITVPFALLAICIFVNAPLY